MNARFDLDLDDLERYRPEIAEPADFNRFWEETIRENPFDEAALKRVRWDGPLTGVDVWDVTFPGYAGEPVKAWFIAPRGATADLPVVVEFIGYGGGRGMPFEWLTWPNAGYAHLVMDTRGQGAWGPGGDTPDPHGTGPAVPGMMSKGIEEPRGYYYRRVFVDAHHAVEAAAAMPETDAQAVVAHGVSQGGGIAIAAAGLNPRVAAALPDVPFLCHFARSVGLTGANPYAEVTRYLAVFRERAQQVFTTLSYFDGVNLGKRARVPALFSAALMDEVCPPSSVFAARNWWGAAGGASPRADIEVYPFNGHEGGQGYQWLRQVRWLNGLIG